MRQDIIRHQQDWENKFNTDLQNLDEHLTDYACAQAEDVLADWQKLAIYLMVRYRDGQEYKAEKERFLRDRFNQPLYPDRPAYPEEYLKTIAPHTVHE